MWFLTDASTFLEVPILGLSYSSLFTNRTWSNLHRPPSLQCCIMQTNMNNWRLSIDWLRIMDIDAKDNDDHIVLFDNELSKEK